METRRDMVTYKEKDRGHAIISDRPFFLLYGLEIFSTYIFSEEEFESKLYFL